MLNDQELREEIEEIGLTEFIDMLIAYAEDEGNKAGDDAVKIEWEIMQSRLEEAREAAERVDDDLDEDEDDD